MCVVLHVDGRLRQCSEVLTTVQCTHVFSVKKKCINKNEIESLTRIRNTDLNRADDGTQNKSELN